LNINIQKREKCKMTNLYLVNLMGDYQEDIDYGNLYTSNGMNEFGEYVIIPQACPGVTFETELKTAFHDLFFITPGEYKAVESLLEKIDVALEADNGKPGKNFKRLTEELGELYSDLEYKYKGKPRVEHPEAVLTEPEDKTKYLKGINLNIWQESHYQIHLAVTNPTTGEVKINSIEHTREEKQNKQMKRTHNNLFDQLKQFLVDADKWKEM
jgi:hypothetical protein